VIPMSNGKHFLTADDDGSGIPVNEKNIIGAEEPTKNAELQIVLLKADEKLRRDVVTTRHRGIASLSASASGFFIGGIVALIANVATGVVGPGVTRVLIIIGAIVVATLGLSIGFFLSIPDKLRRRSNLQSVMSKDGPPRNSDV
jgi:hypothetical protein